VNLGGELGLLSETLRLRVGYRDLFLDENEFDMTFGLSINEVNVVGDVFVTVEYGYQKYVHLGHSDRFSLAIRF
jgi:hypothetical protein